MKKLMICSLILLPLVILAILLASGSVVGLTSYVYVEYISFVEDEIVLQKVSSEDVYEDVKINVFPLIANNRKVILTTGDSSIATVRDGKVYSVDFGQTYIYAKSAEDATKQALCKVIVTDDKIHRLSINNEVSVMNVGESHALNVSYVPSVVANPTLIYTSSNENVVSVTPDGVLQAKDIIGKATITVKSEANPNAKYSFEVRVRVPLEDIYIDDATEVVTGRSEYQFPTVAKYPHNAETTISYLSSDPSIATVDENGVVNFVRKGTVTITVSATGIDKKINKQITYTGGYFTDVRFNIDEITIDYEDYIANPNIQGISVLCVPSDGNYDNLRVTSSNSNVVDVVNGKYVVRGGGTATITATATTPQGGNATASMKIVVNRKASDIEFYNQNSQGTNYVFTLNPSYSIVSSILPLDASEKIIVWQSSNTNIATVNNGIVNFKVPYGEVVITAKTASIERKLTVYYVGSGVNPMLTNAGENIKNIVMPQSSMPQSQIFAPYIIKGGANKISYQIAGDPIINRTGAVFEVTNKGTATIKVLVNDVEYSNIKVSSYRKVEDIKDITFKATWDSDEMVLSGNKMYTSAKSINIDYTLYPANTSLKQASISVLSTVANISGDVITFSSAGSATITINADGVSKSYVIDSTYGLLDKNTATVESIKGDFGDVFEVEDFVTSVSPVNADYVNNIKLTSSSNKVEVTNNAIKLVAGGVAAINIAITTPTGIINRSCVVNINQTATAVNIVNDGLYTNNHQVDITKHYSVYPLTANTLIGATFEVIDDVEYASVDEDGVLTFNLPGIAFVKVTLQNGVTNTVCVVYTGDLAVINGSDVLVPYEVGDKFILKPTKSLDKTANFEITGDIKLTNGVVLSLTNGSATGEKNATVTIMGTTYNFAGVVSAKDLSFSYGEGEVDNDNGKLITGLSEVTLIPTIIPANATTRDIVYISSDTKIANVVGGKLVFAKAGEVTITAYVGKATTSIKIESTYGAFKSLKFVDSIPSTFTYDNETTDNNIIDISKYIQGVPSQVAINSSNITLKVANATVSDNPRASVSGLNLNLLLGGEITISIEGSGLTDSANITINRSATSIMLNGELIDNIDSTTLVSTSFVMIDAKPYPQDANIDNVITKTVQGTNAVFEGNRLVFKAEDTDIVVTYKMANFTWDVIYRTDNIVYSVNVDDNTLVVLAGEKFALYSKVGDTFEAIDLTSDSDNNYMLMTSNVSEVEFEINGTIVSKTLIVTSRANQLNTGDVVIEDVKDDKAENIAIADGDTHTTASKEVKLSYTYVSGVNADGTNSSIAVTINNDVANYQNGKITFAKSGTIIVTITITGSDVHSEYAYEYSFNIYSSFGKADDFSFVSPYNSYIVIDEVTSFSVLNQAKATYPLYGVITPNFRFSSSNESIAMIDETTGVVSVINTGEVTITATVVKGNGESLSQNITIVIEKYIDAINITKGDKVLLNDATNDNTYQVNVNKLSDCDIEPTLLGVTYSITGNATISELGVVDFGDKNFAVATVTIKAVNGGATTSFVITKVDGRVDSRVEIVDIDEDSSDSLVLNNTKKYFFNTVFSNTATSINYSLYSKDLTIVDAETNTVNFPHGTSTSIDVVGATKTISIIVTERVDAIGFKEDAPSTTLVTARGEAGHTINLNIEYGATIIPATARDESGVFEVEYTVTNVTGQATISNGVLTFTKAGTVTITFSADGKTATRDIESTMGYAKVVSFTSNIDGMAFEYDTNATYTISSSDYTFTPADAYKLDFVYDSDDEEVYTVTNNVLTLVGGGTSVLTLNYLTPSGEASTTKSIFVNNKITNISVNYKDNIVGYILYNGDDDLPLDLLVTYSGTKPSPYKIKYESSNSEVVVDELGVVTFTKDNIQSTITISSYNEKTKVVDYATTLIVRNTNTQIIDVTSNILEHTQSSPAVISADTVTTVSILPLSNTGDKNFTFSVAEADKDILSVDEQGVITVHKGGYANITITASSNQTLSSPSGVRINTLGVSNNSPWTKTITILAHKSASLVIGNNNLSEDNTLYTVASVVDVNPSIIPLDAVYAKQIVYEFDNTLASIDANGQITFLKAGELTVTMKVIYGQITEDSKVFSIKSSFGRLDKFDLKQGSSDVASSYTINEGDTLSFTVDKVYPADFVGSVSFEIEKATVIKASVNNNVVTITESQKGESNITIIMDNDIKKTINITVLRLSTHFVVKYANAETTQIDTLDRNLKINTTLYPLDASNTGYSYTFNNNQASIDDEGNISLPSSDQNVSYILTITALDGVATTEIKINYKKDITNFTISSSGVVIASSYDLSNPNSKPQTNPLATLNNDSIKYIVNIHTNPVSDSVDYSQFSVTSINGTTYTISQNIITLTTPKIDSMPHFSDTITIKYKNLWAVTIDLYRYGITDIQFGNDLVNEHDYKYGLQNLRVFGIKTYHNTNKSLTAYKLPFNVYTANDAVVPNTSLDDYVLWSGTNTSIINWGSSDSAVKILSVIKENGQYYALVDFTQFAGYLTEKQVREDDVEGGKVRVSSYNNLGNESCGYTFTMVNAVNVYEKEGFLNTSFPSIVLQRHFGHTDEKKDLKEDEYAFLDGYAGKTTIYGNGYTINYNYYNTETDTHKANADYGYIQLSNNQNLYNVVIKGFNNGLEQKDKHVEFSSTLLNAHYVDFTNMFRVIENASTTVTFRRCVIRNMARQGMLIQKFDGTNGGNVYLEDVIMFNCGYMALESQHNDANYYIKGFVDVYNYQSTAALKEFANADIVDALKDYKGYVVNELNNDWANVIFVSTMLKTSVKSKQCYFSDENGNYAKSDTGNKYAGEGFKKLLIKRLGFINVAAVYTYDANFAKKPTFYQQYNSDGSINSAYMNGQVNKVSRLDVDNLRGTKSN